MKKKVISLLITTVTLVGVLAGCENKVSNNRATEKVQATVGTWKTAQTLTPFFYEDFLTKGDQVEILPFTNPGDQKVALLAGSLDMTGTTLPTAIAARASGEPIKIVASLCNKCSALVVKEDSAIKKEADLKGKTIGYVPGTMHHVLLLDVLQRAGLNADTDVTLVRIDFFDMGQALASGEIDAFLSGEPYPSQAVKEGFGRILSYPYFDDSIGTINAAMIVTEDMIKENPGKVQKLVNAHIAATEYENKNRDAWLEKAASFGTDKALLEVSADNIELGWEIDEMYIQNAKNLAEQMLQLGMIDNIPDIDAMFDLSFIQQAKKK
ncbi:aliphatic sulfonates ABC transporter substrate-binding protein [Sporanaerobium hydrogeniformans]|uniref:Aliphatic sulfonates ABC transporter substrate-binding protein n=1 Tax=Sporanaerobium hydrogeniformans TaxID=3072179 RepID=A0AC61DEA3_9FIRM|nr:ABC transporter substrate-binding protein [Sporanaerobium hydrogeniformans]PHV71247.1 aliphatic sulfonates ABC transporter substrate-binding protein [Sporanaerobium hydrogeniformans]